MCRHILTLITAGWMWSIFLIPEDVGSNVPRLYSLPTVLHGVIHSFYSFLSKQWHRTNQENTIIWKHFKIACLITYLSTDIPCQNPEDCNQKYLLCIAWKEQSFQQYNNHIRWHAITVWTLTFEGVIVSSSPDVHLPDFMMFPITYYWVPGIVPGSRFCLLILFKQPCS